jgi:hypothetical protein
MHEIAGFHELHAVHERELGHFQRAEAAAGRAERARRRDSAAR